MGTYRDYNYFKKITVSTTNFADAIATWNFVSTGIAIMVESNIATDVIQYSFDGSDVHGDMTPLFPSEAIIFDNRAQSKIWFRRASGSGAVTVRVEAWRN